MKASNITFDNIDKAYFSFHKKTKKTGGKYTELRGWLKNEKATINPKIRNKECFKYTFVALLHHKEINPFSIPSFSK